jgi:cytochrome c peroxidase
MKFKLRLSENIFLFSIIFVATFLIAIFFLPHKYRLQEKVDVSIFAPQLPGYIFNNDDNSINPALITLGRDLYYDKRLSRNRSVSCDSCHKLENYGVDNKAFSTSYQGLLHKRNTPSVYYAAGHIAQCWDGRYPNLEEQVLGAILNPLEMGISSQERLIEILQSIPEYVKAFQKAFPTEANPVIFENIGKAIGAFERGLVPLSPFDAYFAGYQKALSAKQKRGLNLFVDIGCATCHNGTYFGTQMFKKISLYQAWPNQEDLGRYEVTKESADLMMFKIPSLRNIGKTAPYYHDGSVKTLEEAVKLMAANQLGKKLNQNQLEDIVAFLESLTGKIPREYITKPILPIDRTNIIWTE